MTAISLRASVTIVQNLVNELRQLARRLPAYRDEMTALANELNGIYNEIIKIQEKLEELSTKPLSENDEIELMNLDNRINKISIQLLGDKINFQGHWIPIFSMSVSPNAYIDFQDKYGTIVDNSIEIVHGLRSSINSRSEWVRSKKNSRIEQRLKYLTVVLTLTVLAEVFIGMAQIYRTLDLLLTAIAIGTPIIISLIYIGLMPKNSQ